MENDSISTERESVLTSVCAVRPKACCVSTVQNLTKLSLHLISVRSYPKWTKLVSVSEGPRSLQGGKRRFHINMARSIRELNRARTVPNPIHPFFLKSPESDFSRCSFPVTRLRDDGAIVLLVRNDLPRESTLCALAHASAHAFLGESAPSEVVEPFARFAEYYFLGSLKEGGGVTPNLRFDAHYRREQMRSKDSKLRVFHKTVNQSGGSIVQVVEYIKTNQSFPSSGQLM